MLLLGLYGIRIVRRRSTLVYPDKNGIFPTVEVSLPGGHKVIHDPNRQMSGTTVYLSDGERVQVTPVIAPGLEDSQRAATAQGATIQEARAAVSGAGLTDHVQEVVKKLLPGPADTVPKARVLASEAPDIERLIDEGEGDELSDDPR